MTDSRKGSSADNRNDGLAAGTGQMLRQMLRSMLIGGSARHGGLEELNTSLHAEHQRVGCVYLQATATVCTSATGSVYTAFETVVW
jgi:hypothetical protein